MFWTKNHQIFAKYTSFSHQIFFRKQKITKKFFKIPCFEKCALLHFYMTIFLKKYFKQQYEKIKKNYCNESELENNF